MRTPSSTLRGFTLVELIVSQVIVGIIAAGVFGLIAAQTQSFHSNWSATEAQVRLREATHLMLRDAQGLGDVSQGAGEMIGFVDGGSGDADELFVYRNDVALCQGGLGVDTVAGDTLQLTLVDYDLDGTDDCPIDDAATNCPSAELVGSSALVIGDGPLAEHAVLLVTAANAGTCSVTFADGANGNYKQFFDVAHPDLPSQSSVSDVIAAVGSVTGVSFGNRMHFYVNAPRENLMRMVNAQAETVVVEGIRDLQVQAAHDVDNNDVIANTEWRSTATLTDATAFNFRAMRIGLMAFANSKRSIEVAPPNIFGNRDHSAAPGGRRYRQSFVIAAARN